VVLRPRCRDRHGPGSELPPGVHRPGPDVIPPVLVTRTQPEYSEAARLAGLEGTVLLEAVIDEDGSATVVRVARPLGLDLDEKAIDAVRVWHFKPGLYRALPAPILTDDAVVSTAASKTTGGTPG